MASKNEKTQARTTAIEFLRKHLKLGDKVTTCVLHAARSGMSRTVMCQAIIVMQDKKPEIADISWAVAAAIGARFDDKRGGVIMTGCGTDMRFEAVYSLGRVLFPGGFKVKECGRNGDTSGHDKDGGYALKHS